MKKILLSAVTAGFLSARFLFGAMYDVDTVHSSVNFNVSHMSVSKVDGNFPEFSGMVEIDPKSKFLIKLEGEIDISKINTRNEKRDSHLLNTEYFDATNFPKGTLKTTKISKDKKGLKVEADLTLKGITKKVVLTGDLKGPIQNPMTKKETWGLNLKGTINRKHFNIAKDTAALTMGEDVNIEISLELHAQ